MPNETTNTVPLPVIHEHLTSEDIKKGCIEISKGGDGESVRLCRIGEELHQGLSEMESYNKAVTFYGSARFVEGDPYYDRARTLAGRISKELGFTVTTGGGPGIMEAGNRGAYEAGGKSVGLSISLPNEQKNNPYTTDLIPFYFFFSRKITLSFASEVFIFFPGGFGTLDEFFEMITLIQTKKIPAIPVVLYGTDFWNPIMDLMKTLLLDKFKTVDATDFNLFKITDSDDEVIEIIKKSPPRVHDISELS